MQKVLALLMTVRLHSPTLSALQARLVSAGVKVGLPAYIGLWGVGDKRPVRILRTVFLGLARSLDFMYGIQQMRSSVMLT